jgi:hypothetical protein
VEMKGAAPAAAEGEAAEGAEGGGEETPAE